MALCRTLSVVCVLLGCVTCFLLDDQVQDLVGLINQEKHLRATLEQELQQLQADIDATTAAQTTSLCDCKAPGVIAFSASLTHDITSFGTKQHIVYDNVITNVGGAYDSRHGSFRAPVSGIYQFSFSILQGQSTMWLGVELVLNGKVIGRIKTGDNGYWNMGSNVINAHLNAGQEVWVQHMSDSDNKHAVASTGYFTMFSGHLISAD